MKKAVFIVLFVSIMAGLNAQQIPQFSQYMFNRTFINPATVGSSDAICLGILGRNQWMGFKDRQDNAVNPQSYGFNFDMPIHSIKSGVGLIANYYQMGAEKNTEIKVQYAYHHTFRKKSILSLGLGLSVLSKYIDYSKLQQHEYDPLLTSIEKESGTITDLGFGLYYRIPNRFRIGFSATNLLGSSAEIGGPDITMARHLFLHAGYDVIFKIGSYRELILTPGFLVKNTKGSTQADLNLMLSFERKVWLGLLYRVEQAIGVMAGFSYKGFSLGLAYDFTLASWHTADAKGSIEAFVKYCYPFTIKIPKRSGYNTRNL